MLKSQGWNSCEACSIAIQVRDVPGSAVHPRSRPFGVASSSAMPTFRSSGSFGKRQEYIAVAELLRRGFDVYMTLVDDQQIDCVVRIEVDGHPAYIDVQIKARSKDAKQPGTFAALEVRDPRPNFMFVFYSEGANTYWVMPSLDLVREATEKKGVRPVTAPTRASSRSCSRTPGLTGLSVPDRGSIPGRRTGTPSPRWRLNWLDRPPGWTPPT